MIPQLSRAKRNNGLILKQLFNEQILWKTKFAVCCKHRRAEKTANKPEFHCSERHMANFINLTQMHRGRLPDRVKFRVWIVQVALF